MSVKYEERTEVKNGKSYTIGIATLDHKPVNALSAGVRAGLAKISSQVKSFPVDAVIICGSGSQFCAGADISEFSDESNVQIKHPLADVIQSIEDLEIPVVAAIHGFAFGGGLELALGCHYRVATDNANVGLPEVKLGIIPGAGGTQRLPRIIGVQKAIEYITSGNPISAKKAKELNLVDHLVKTQKEKSPLESVVEGAIDFIVSNNLRARKTSSNPIEPLDPEFWNRARSTIQKSAKGYLAPLHCLEAIKGCTLPFAEGIARENEIIMRVIRSPQAVAQQYLFFAERQASKNQYTTGTAANIKTVGIIGAGTMGAGIAINFLSAGIKTLLLEKEQKFLDAGVERIVSTYSSYVKRGSLTKEKVDQIMSLLVPTTNLNDFSSVDLVIEAVFEEMNIKKDIFASLDSICPPSTILCTNTSTLDVDEISSATKRPDKVIGTHFFSPANIMKLLEIVRGKKTSADTITTVFKLGQRIKKVCVVVGNCDGFVGNRMLEGYGNEANFLLEEGATPQQVDKVLATFGMAMGPFTMYDVAGGDVGFRIRKGKAATRDPRERYPGIADRLCELGRFGQKTSKGWYLYKKEDPRKPVIDPEVISLIENYSAEIGFTRRNIPDDEVFWRCMLPLINEGFKILEEGIANSASDIDVIWIYGYGWPPYTGGPMHFAETTGLDKILAMLLSYSEKHPNISHFKPANLLQTLVREKTTISKHLSKL